MGVIPYPLYRKGDFIEKGRSPRGAWRRAYLHVPFYLLSWNEWFVTHSWSSNTESHRQISERAGTEDIALRLRDDQSDGDVDQQPRDNDTNMHQGDAVQPRESNNEPVCSRHDLYDPKSDMGSTEEVSKTDKRGTESKLGGPKVKKRTRRSRRKRGVGGGSDQHHKEAIRDNPPTQQPVPDAQAADVPNLGIKTGGCKDGKEYPDYNCTAIGQG